MNKMYRKSKIWMNQAKESLKHVSEDDIYIDMACYNSQQAIEFILKSVLQEKGIQFEKSHDIRYLLNLIPDDFTFTKRDALELIADTITDWEQKSRYGDGVKTSVQTVQRTHNIYNSIDVSYVKAFIPPDDSDQNHGQGKKKGFSR